MGYHIVMRLFVGMVTLLSIAVLVYVFSFPPQSTRVSRAGVPFFTPEVINPETGEAMPVDELVRHYKGD